MPKMQVLDDGTVEFPIKGGNLLTLDEPSLGELAWMHDETERIDKEMTDLPSLPAQIDVKTATPEQLQQFRDDLQKFNEANNTRTLQIFGSADHQPYAGLVLQVLQKLASNGDGSPITELSPDQLYGWSASPRVMRTLLEHFRSPLPGTASPPNL